MLPAVALRNPCPRCNQREADSESAGLCVPCFDEIPATGPLPAWVDEWWKVRGPEFAAEQARKVDAHRTPLVPARNFGELFTDFAALTSETGAEHYDRDGHGPIEMPCARVSRYCSVAIGGRRYALAVLPTADLLKAICGDDLLMRAWAKVEGLQWTIETFAGSPNASVYYVHRGLTGWGSRRLVALIKTSTIPTPTRHA